MTLSFEYYEVRPCVEYNGDTISFQDSAELGTFFMNNHVEGSVFWTVYGVEGGEASAIGDFKSQAAALGVVTAILSSLMQVLGRLEALCCDYTGCRLQGENGTLRNIVSLVEDVINQPAMGRGFDMTLLRDTLEIASLCVFTSSTIILLEVLIR